MIYLESYNCSFCTYSQLPIVAKMHIDNLRNESSRGLNWVAQGCKHVKSGSTKYLGTLEKGATGKEIP